MATFGAVNGSSNRDPIDCLDKEEEKQEQPQNDKEEQEQQQQDAQGQQQDAQGQDQWCHSANTDSREYFESMVDYYYDSAEWMTEDLHFDFERNVYFAEFPGKWEIAPFVVERGHFEFAKREHPKNKKSQSK